MNVGDRLTLNIEKPAAGGRMIARHDGAVILVSSAIPGEKVEAEVEKLQRGTVWARTVRVLQPSDDRVDPPSDWTCGGNVLAHVCYPRQIAIKREIILDAFTRIGRIALDNEIVVAESPTESYRMRARLHVDGRRIGFFREGTHQLCDAAASGQLLPSSIVALRALEEALTTVARAEVMEIELAENMPADQRAVHLVLGRTADPSALGTLPRIAGVTGVSCGHGDAPRALTLWGTPEITDTFSVPGAGAPQEVSLTRQAHAFFQGNRYLLPTLVAAVMDVVPRGRVLDLYAGVGLFSVPLGRRTGTSVVAIEGDHISAGDLKRNAGGAIEARHQSVESFLAARRSARFDTVIVDPPRTGMTKAALEGAIALRASRLVYVSCDVATLARDARRLVDAGYRVRGVRAFDLFPRTAHVETLAIFER